MNSRFLLTKKIPNPGLAMLQQAGEVTVLSSSPTKEELASLCASGKFDVVITQLSDSLDADLLRRAQITGICNYAAGFNNIDVAAADNYGIPVANTPGVLTDATADVAMALMLSTARRVVEADAFLRSGRFTGWEPELLLGQDVSGSTLGLAGFGRIARATARRALAFGMEVIFTPRPPGERLVSREELGEFYGYVTQAPWHEVVERSDYLSLHVPLTQETKHLIDADTLTRMKPTSILINTSRGPVVDESALVEALKEGEITGAGLDVYEQEPKAAPGLTDLPNTVLLPHLGSATKSVRAEMSRLTANNAIAMINGKKPPHLVEVENSL